MELESSEWIVLRVNQEEIEEADILWIINKSTTGCALDLGISKELNKGVKD